MVYIIRHGWTHAKWSKEVDCEYCDCKFLVVKGEFEVQQPFSYIHCPECGKKVAFIVPKGMVS